ncbi:MAG: hypothetical protein IPM98_11380 [Lewinellaceae bacterium]|nr:hypothetical protein [Lewinellaceae bacterium]
MLRVASYALLVGVVFSLTAYQSGDPKFLERPLPVNSTLATIFFEDEPHISEDIVLAPADSVGMLRILMLNYTAYDSAYASKMKELILKRLPGAVLTEFWEGSSQSLAEILTDQHVVVVTYPSTGNTQQVRAYGKVLKQYIQQGGAIVFSGTDQFGILQHYGLFDLDFGYFCSGMEVHEDVLDHPVLAGTPSDFSLANYIYPLDISDPNFVVLANIHGYPTVGYKPIGQGKVVYLGLEYYYDEAVSTRILENTLRWLGPDQEEGSVAAAQVSDNNIWTSVRDGVRRKGCMWVPGVQHLLQTLLRLI